MDKIEIGATYACISIQAIYTSSGGNMPIRRDGQITRGTRQNLIDGLRNRPMLPETVDNALNQAVEFTEALINLYQTQIAAGEVGPGGSGSASDEPIRGERSPTALLYGRVQSGKTAAMILTTALALDNGFKIVIVLTADNVALVRQTSNRFKALDGPRVFSSDKDDGYEWEGQEGEIRSEIATDGLVLVCAKDAFHLPAIIRFLQQIEAPAYPTLVFDDEADAATPDTTLEARTSGRSSAPLHASTINRRVVRNTRPGEEGESIGEVFPHRMFVQVTATPYVLYLLRKESDIRPNYTFLLEPGAGYCGGERFFGRYDGRPGVVPEAPIVLVPDNEALAINRRPMPPGLKASVDFFLLSSLGIAARDGHWPNEGYKHLSHSSHRIDQHTVVAGHIERYLWDLRREVREDEPATMERFQVAYHELQRTMPGVAGLDMLVRALPGALRQTEIRRINSETDVPEYGPRMNFLVGGNILGRGLTIEDLLVTYYIREAQVSQMDTVWQHARMYGYRNALMPFTRVYLPRRVGIRFKEIHETEEALRDVLRQEAAGEEVPIRLAQGTRATRRNATEPRALTFVRAGLAQLHPRYLHENIGTENQIKDALIAVGAPVGDGDRQSRAVKIPLDRALEIIDLLGDEQTDGGSWRGEAIGAILDSHDEQLGGSMTVYVRGLIEEPPPEGWIRGRLGGPEIDIIRAAAGRAPSLALLYKGNKQNPGAWYPTLVMPPDSAAFLINAN